MNDQELHSLCLAWQHWIRTRRLLGAPKADPEGLLAKMQPKGGGMDPDGPMSAALAAFDAAYRAHPEGVDLIAFTVFYRRGAKRVPIKVAADELGISRKTFYKAVARARSEIYARSLDVLRTRANTGESNLTGKD